MYFLGNSWETHGTIMRICWKEIMGIVYQQDSIVTSMESVIEKRLVHELLVGGERDFRFMDNDNLWIIYG